MLGEITAVSNITSTTLSCSKTTSRILKFFCYDYFEDLIALITFAKNFDFLAAGVIFKLFASKNAHATNRNVLLQQNVV